MKIKFICIGKTGKPFLEEGEKEYLTRLKHYVSIERIEIADIRNAKSLTKAQIHKIEEHCEILHANLDTIEACGGGSARCMMAEVFLPKQ
jgi:23S rRNA pseudoU1915 N3-methylase RlmH